MGADERGQLNACAKVTDRDERLACFDALVTMDRSQPGEPAAGAASPGPMSATESPGGSASPAEPGGSRLSRLWELDPGDKHQVLTFRPYRDNYVLFANHSRNPNSQPYVPFRRLAPDAGLSHTEVVFQLGFKMKLVEAAMSSPFDLWFGYTQQSFWQAYNHRASSPFRESNYQPELMVVAPLDLQLLGWRARLINLGFVHQSNGQASTLSRSWNRLYAQAGLERGDLTLLARVWKPVGSLEDNPDIQDFLGHGDLVGTYRWRGHEFSVLARQNWKTHRGALQGSWAFPLKSDVKGYVQLFSGYGDSMINYNARQQTLGLGVLVAY
jgi:phospholipase A1